MLNQIFTYWENEIGVCTPPFIKLCIESMQKSCKEFVLLTPDNIYEYLNENDLNPAWKLLPYIAQKADCLRVAIIKKYGGWWCDADTMFIRSIDLLENFIDETKDLCFLQWTDGRILNGYFYAKKESVILSEWLKAINKVLSNSQPLGWASLGEDILTPLVQWKFPDKCQQLSREIFIPINFDKVPALFFENIDYYPFIKHNTIAVALNHSWFVNVCPALKTMMLSELQRSNTMLGNLCSNSYDLNSVNVMLQDAIQKYSFGAISVGDIYVLAHFFTGLDRVVELGTNQGTTARLLSLVCKYVVTVDVFEDLHLIYNDIERERYKIDFKNNAHTFSQICNYLSERQNVEIVKSLTSIYLHTLPDNSIDGVFIDDDHSYHGVSVVYAAAFSKLKVGGLFLFHDVNKDHLGVFDFYNDMLLVDDRIEEIEYTPATYYTSIKAFRRIK
jgi:hypothetical protein